MENNLKEAKTTDLIIEIRNRINVNKDNLSTNERGKEIGIAQLLDWYLSFFKPAKKKNIVSGSFYMNGRYDVPPGQFVTLEIYGTLYSFNLTGGVNKPEEVINLLFTKYQIQSEDILHAVFITDVVTDTIKLEFAFQTDLDEGQFPSGRDIKLIMLGKTWTGGQCNWNKVLLRGSAPEFNAPEIYNYPLRSFSVSYGLPGEFAMYLKIMEYLKANIIENGIAADMRSFGNTPGLIDMVNLYKEKKWKRINIPGKLILQQWDGTYKEFIQ